YHGIRARRGLLRRRDARQGLGALRRPAAARRGAAVGVRARQIVHRSLHADEDQGRAARGGARAWLADRAGHGPRRGSRQPAARRTRVLAAARAPRDRARRHLSRSVRALRRTAHSPPSPPADRRRAHPRRLRRRAGPRCRRPRPPSNRVTVSGGRLPLDDVRILDFMWVLAGPSATRVLAGHGALVVRVESTRRIDTARTLAPFHDGVPGAERSALFHNTNASKRML